MHKKRDGYQGHTCRPILICVGTSLLAVLGTSPSPHNSTYSQSESMVRTACNLLSVHQELKINAPRIAHYLHHALSSVIRAEGFNEPRASFILNNPVTELPKDTQAIGVYFACVRQ